LAKERGEEGGREGRKVTMERGWDWARKRQREREREREVDGRRED
jgi:hypothetical protein